VARVRTPIVIAPDIILDLVMGRGGAGHAAELLFDAVAAGLETAADRWPAYVAPTTITTVHYLAKRGAGPTNAGRITSDLLRLVRVAPLANEDYAEALHIGGYAYEDAIQFVTCRRVGAKYLVTGNDFGGVKRAPVRRRTAAEMLALFAMRTTRQW
jgi:hypothetical protein